MQTLEEHLQDRTKKLSTCRSFQTFLCVCVLLSKCLSDPAAGWASFLRFYLCSSCSGLFVLERLQWMFSVNIWISHAEADISRRSVHDSLCYFFLHGTLDNSGGVGRSLYYRNRSGCHYRRLYFCVARFRIFLRPIPTFLQLFQFFLIASKPA